LAVALGLLACGCGGAATAGERIPAGVRTVSVSLRYPERHLSLTRTVRTPATVARLVALIDALKPPARPGATRSQCGAERFAPASLGLVFHGPRGTAALAQVDVTECTNASVWVRGEAQPALSGELTLIERVISIVVRGPPEGAEAVSPARRPASSAAGSPPPGCSAASPCPPSSA